MDHPVGDPFSYFWSKGYHDLLPVIPASATGVNSPGKCPGVKLADGKWQGRDRKAFVASEELIRTWRQWGAGVGIRCYNGIVAVDVDTLSEEWSKKISEIVFRVLGRSAVRIGQYPKTLIVFRASVATRYRQVRFQDGVNPKGALVELLAGANCWFVAHGTHPRTGELYRWPDGVPEAKDLTFVTAEKLEELFDELKAVLPASKFSGTGGIRSDIDQGILAAENPLLIMEAFGFIKNDFSRIGYHQWIEMAVALRAALPNDPGTAESMFVDWSEGYVNPQCSAYKMFWSVNPPFKLGAQYIFDKAAEGGWDISNRWADRTILTDKYRIEPPPAAAAAAPDAKKDEEDKEEEYVSPFAFATQGPPPKKYEFISAEEAARRAYEDAGQLPLVEGLLDQSALSVIFGGPNAGKSFFMLDLAFHIALGKPYAGLPVSRGLAVYIALEGSVGIYKRLAACIHKHGLPGDNFRLLNSSVDLRRPDADVQPLIGQLLDLAKELDRPIVHLTVDTLFRALAGGDENSPVDMGALVKHVDLIRKHVKCHVSFVHHTGKDKAKGSRGHSSLLAAVDTEIEIEATERNKGTVATTKQRDMEASFEATFVIETLFLGLNAMTGKKVEPGVIRITRTGVGTAAAGAAGAAKKGRPGQYADMVVDAVKQFAGGITEKDLIIHLQLENDRDGKRKLHSTLVRLRGNHRMTVDAKGRYSVLSNVFD